MKVPGLIIAALGALALAQPGLAAAQATAAAQPGQDAAAEEKLDEGLKRFGYLAGLAQVCVADQQKAALDREVLEINSSILRLLGSDRAFLFSTSFGYGTSVEVATKDCAEILKNYEARVARHRAAAGGAK